MLVKTGRYEEDMLFIIQNDPEVPPGNFNDTLTELDVPSRIIHPYAGNALPPAGDIAACIVLGGSMGVHDTERHPFLVGVKGFIGSCLRNETPLLGICLGGQLLADLLGGVVIAGSPHGEKGTLPVTLTGEGEKDPLFAGVPREFISFQWHNDSFDVPAEGVHLASSPACPAQAFRFGSRAWGTQFHPEVNRSIVESWARWTDETAPMAESYVADFLLSERSYLEVSRKLLVNFLRIAGLWR
jgi:GMP synthase-like glutamine amidotransferase